MATSAAEQLARQTVQAIGGLEARFTEIIQELPDDRQEYWKHRMAEEVKAAFPEGLPVSAS